MTVHRTRMELARRLLVALRDSMKTFRDGRPEVSLAAMNSTFGCDMMMMATAGAGAGAAVMAETKMVAR